MMKVCEEKSEINYEFYLNKYANYLVNQVSKDGYISASKDYHWYKPHWIRDSSWVAISLIEYASHVDAKLSKNYLNAASNIIKFNIKAFSKYRRDIEVGLSLDNPDEFSKLKYHIPARLDHEFLLFKDIETYYDKNIDDSNEVSSKNSWLNQYDSLPLILLSLNVKRENFGLNDNEKQFIHHNKYLIARYLCSIYTNPCSNAWEIRQLYIHSYDVGLILKSLDWLVNLVIYSEGIPDKKLIDLIDGEQNKRYEGGIIKFFTDKFIKDGVIYSDYDPYRNEIDEGYGVDSSEIFLFGKYGMSDYIDKSYIDNTIKLIDKDLFSGELLPIRFKNDEYFYGGRWILLGGYFSEYNAYNYNLKKAESIIDYVINRYNFSLPEQELVNPAIKDHDTENLYERNNGTIQNLAWSYASMITAILGYLKIKDH